MRSRLPRTEETVRDQRIEQVVPLLTPALILHQQPLSEDQAGTVLRGREEIAAWVEDVCARDMTHRIEQPVLAGDRAAFVEACRYADGTNVLCATVLEVAGGRIVRQTAVQAWDE